MKRFIIPLIAVIAIGCSSSPEQHEDTVYHRTVEEINAERGDPCDCIDSKIEVIDGFISEVKEGIFKIELEVYLDKKNNFDNFIAKGSVSNFKSEIKKNLSFDNSSFNFFADKSDILLKNIIGNVGPINISEGDLQIKFSKEVTLIDLKMISSSLLASSFPFFGPGCGSMPLFTNASLRLAAAHQTKWAWPWDGTALIFHRQKTRR